MRSRLSLLPVVLIAGGCYAYYPAATPLVPDERRVMITLNDSGTFLLAPKIGPFGSDVEGLLVANPDSAFTLSVVAVHRFNGSMDSWRGEQLIIPKRFITTLTERHFSPGRTGLFTGGLAVVMTVVRGAFRGNNSSGGVGGSGTVVGK